MEKFRVVVWCNSCRDDEDGCFGGSADVIGSAFEFGKTLRKPVPNTALNCLIGIASSKTILIERLFKHRIERLFKHSPQRRGAGEARALHA